MKNYNSYSVLMSVYAKEKAEYLKTAMDSMWHQTVLTDDFVLVCDGPLNDELDTVITEMKKSHFELHVIRLEKNVGLGRALNIGINHCKNELIARMDSDDISKPDRCEKELAVFTTYPEVSIVGSSIDEFAKIEAGSFFPHKNTTKRVVPEKIEDIMAFARKRNPFNHPSVMYKKSAVLCAGNYKDLRYIQDYYLWISMLLTGFKGYNIQESLVYMRMDSNFFHRRAGKLYRDTQLKLFKYMKEQGFISSWQYLKSCILRVGSSIAPNWLREFMFKKVLRKAIIES